MNRPNPRLVVLGLAAMLATASQAMADDPKPAKIDAEARALLDEVVQTYRGLNAYADSGQFGMAITINDQEQKQEQPMALTFVRPNKLDLNLGAARFLSDGKTVWTVISPTRKYTEEKAPEKITLDTFKQGPVGALLFGGPTGMTEGIVLALLTDDDAAKIILEGTDGLKLEADREVDGQKVKALLVDQSQGPDIRLLVDAKTKLLTGIDLVIDPKQLTESAPKGTTIKVGRLGWTPGTVVTKAPKDDAFAFKTPEGFSKVDSIAEALGRPGGNEPEAPAMAMVGKNAPDFTMTVLDGDKTKQLSKADLAGQVVMIDFWATWCGPCLKELPEVAEMVKSFAKDKKPVKVIALSVDDNPGQVSEMRKLVEDTLKERKIDLTGTDVGLIALDTKGEIGKTYQATAIPMIVLLDAKGVVQTVHIGYTEREVLEKEINTLLDGKSLITPRDDAKAANAKD